MNNSNPQFFGEIHHYSQGLLYSSANAVIALNSGERYVCKYKKSSQGRNPSVAIRAQDTNVAIIGEFTTRSKTHSKLGIWKLTFQEAKGKSRSSICSLNHRGFWRKPRIQTAENVYILRFQKRDRSKWKLSFPGIDIDFFQPNSRLVTPEPARFAANIADNPLLAICMIYYIWYG